uniref:3'-5' exonuclease domain-containing protein n=1 Tax=Mola mola TaxID=94237 RepID=A0A3Q3W0K2_MOLML
MVVEDIQFLNVFKGKRIKLTLRTSSYLGVVQRINPNRTLVLADGRNNRFIWTAVSLLRPVWSEVLCDFFILEVMHIKKQHVIGVGADGVEAFKHGRLCWLQIACKKKVYLFDILLLGARAFKNGLSAILEDNHCDGHSGWVDCCFGTGRVCTVADVMCFYSDTGGFLPDRVSTLEEVASLHLKVPSSQLSMEVWQKRPSPVPLLKLMALSVVHLQPLRLALLDHLMMDYMTLVDSYLNSSHYEPDELQHVSMVSHIQTFSS